MSQLPNDGKERQLATHIALALERTDLNALVAVLSMAWMDNPPDLEKCEMLAVRVLQYIRDNPATHAQSSHYLRISENVIGMRAEIRLQRADQRKKSRK